MDGFPILDYAPSTLVGIFVLLVFFGGLVPYRIVRQKDKRIEHLESSNEKLLAALKEEQKTGAVVRHFFEGLDVR